MAFAHAIEGGIHMKSSVKDSNQRSLPVILGFLIILTVMLLISALCIGSYSIPVGDTISILLGSITGAEGEWTQMAETVVLQVRMPRVLAAILVGAALAVAGTSYQGIFRNPLVSPDLLGVSSGACIGAAAAILAGIGQLGIQGAAFIGGIVAVCMTISIPKIIKKESTIALVLSGVIVSGFCSAILGLLKYIADPEAELPEIVYWQMGSLAKADFATLAYTAPIIIIGIAILLAMRWRVNVLSLGDQEAKALGVNLRFERGIVIVLSTLLTASAVSLAGTIGWIGLVLPHLARFLVGPNVARSMPVAFIMAAGFMLIVDTLARFSGIEIPLSILTGLIGTPFFVVLLAKQRGML